VEFTGQTTVYQPGSTPPIKGEGTVGDRLEKVALTSLGGTPGSLFGIGSTRGRCVRVPRRVDSPVSVAQTSVIWRCSGCGAIVHVVDVERPVGFCIRCGGVVDAIRDGGDT